MLQALDGSFPIQGPLPERENETRKGPSKGFLGLYSPLLSLRSYIKLNTAVERAMRVEVVKVVNQNTCMLQGKFRLNKLLTRVYRLNYKKGKTERNNSAGTAFLNSSAVPNYVQETERLPTEKQRFLEDS